MQNFELVDIDEVTVRLVSGKVIKYKGFGLNKLRRILAESAEIPKAIVPEVVDYDDDDDGGGLLIEDEEEDMLPRQRRLKSQKQPPPTFVTTSRGSYHSPGINYSPQTGSIADIAKQMQSSSGLSFN